MTTRGKVIELLAKLKALASSCANENEAALAASRMQDLMARHKIAQAELMDLGDEAPLEVDIDDLYSEPGMNFSRWRQKLGYVLAEANNCYGVHIPGWRDLVDEKWIKHPAKMRIIGTRENVAACQYIFRYLCREIDQLARRANAAVKARGFGGGRAYMNSFRVGAFYVITKRIIEQREKIESNETALVLFEREKLAAESWAKQNLDLKVSGAELPFSVGSRAGFADGAHAGKSIALDNNGRTALKQPQKALPGS